MKNKYIYIILVGLLSMVLSSCEDRLDIPKHGNMGGQEESYKTDTEAMQALSSLYSTWSVDYYNWFFLKNLLADDVWCGGGFRGDNTEFERLNEYNFDTDHSVVKAVYQGMYELIYKCNLIIELMQPDTQVKSSVIAEAKFFRAWANFELVTLYGTAPKVDHLLKPDEYRQANSTPETLWAFIEEDLKDAISSDALTTKTDVNDPQGTIRATKEVAQALLGKAYLFQGKYDEAADILNKVVRSGKYDLYRGDYDQLLHAAGDFSCESMLEVQKRNDPDQAWNQYNVIWCMMGWRSDKLNVTGKAANDIATGTYGFMNPRKELYDAFVEMEGENGYRLKSTIRTYSQMNAYGVSLVPGSTLVGHEGYFMWKTRALQSDLIYDNSGWQVLQYQNLRVMRYAEVLLLAAEADVMAGKQPDALYCINEVRTRAHLEPLASVSLEDVKKEKRLELCLESVRFQDLVRWGDAERVLGNQGKEVKAFSSEGVSSPYNSTNYGFKSKHKLLPIPRKEMELNPNMKQNEGWK